MTNNIFDVLFEALDVERNRHRLREYQGSDLEDLHEEDRIDEAENDG